jgi:hypothetical protein
VIPPARARAIPRARRARAVAAARWSNNSDTNSDASSSSDDDATPREQRNKRRENQNADRGGFENAFELTLLSTAAQARAREVELQVQREMEEEDQKETANEANRRRANNGNRWMLHKKVGKNKGVMDDGYVAWLQDKIKNKESSDDSASS